MYAAAVTTRRDAIKNLAGPRAPRVCRTVAAISPIVPRREGARALCVLAPRGAGVGLELMGTRWHLARIHGGVGDARDALVLPPTAAEALPDLFCCDVAVKWNPRRAAMAGPRRHGDPRGLMFSIVASARLAARLGSLQDNELRQLVPRATTAPTD